MISSLQLTNFQSHKKTLIKFHPGVNAIVGETDCGKSSVIRGLNWLVNNRPGGDGFRSHWAKKEETTVSISLDDTNLVLRGKSDKSNYYQADTNIYKAIGTDIPKDVRDLINLSEVNMQKQMDQPFLLAESAGEVARFLNQIIGIDQIDSALKAIDSSIRKNRSEIAFNEKELAASMVAVDKYSWVPDAEQKLKVIEVIDRKIKDMTVENSTLENLINKFDTIEKKKVQYNVKAASIELLTIADLEESTSLSEQIKTLNLLVAKATTNQKNLKFLKEEIARNEKELKRIMPEVCPVCQQIIKK